VVKRSSLIDRIFDRDRLETLGGMLDTRVGLIAPHREPS